MVDQFRTDNPDKYRAQNKVNNAIRDGKLVKGDRCEMCGRTEDDLKSSGLRLEFHHYLGYEEEHWLDVQLLCNYCHKQADLAKDKPDNQTKPVSPHRIKNAPPPNMVLEAARVFAEMEDGIHGEPDEWEYPPLDSRRREKWALEVRAAIPGRATNHPVSHEQILAEVGWPVEEKPIPKKPPAWMLTPEFKSIVGQYRKYQAALRLPESFKVSSFLRPVANEIAMLIYTRIKQSQAGIGKPIPDSVLFGEGWKIMRALGEKDGEIQQAGVNINIANFDLLPTEARKEALAAYFAEAQKEALAELEAKEAEVIEGELVESDNGGEG